MAKFPAVAALPRTAVLQRWKAFSSHRPQIFNSSRVSTEILPVPGTRCTLGLGNPHLVDTGSDYLIRRALRSRNFSSDDIFNLIIGRVKFDFTEIGIPKNLRICKFQVGSFSFVDFIENNKEILDIAFG